MERGCDDGGCDGCCGGDGRGDGGGCVGWDERGVEDECKKWKITLEDARNRIVLYLAYYNDRVLWKLCWKYGLRGKQRWPTRHPIRNGVDFCLFFLIVLGNTLCLPPTWRASQMSFSTKPAPVQRIALVHCLISYDINVLGMITRTAWYYSIFCRWTWAYPSRYQLSKKKKTAQRHISLRECRTEIQNLTMFQRPPWAILHRYFHRKQDKGLIPGPLVNPLLL